MEKTLESELEELLREDPASATNATETLSAQVSLSHPESLTVACSCGKGKQDGTEKEDIE